MMRKPQDFDNAQSYDGTIRKLPVDGYVCKIMDVEEATTKNGKEYWKVSIDIVEGEYKDFYKNMYKNARATAQDLSKVTWKGLYHIFPYTPEGYTNPYFKGFISCVERSNPGFHMNWAGDVSQFKGKIIGLIFREEEFVTNEGTTKISVKPYYCKTVEDIRAKNFDLPQKKLQKNRDGGAVPPGYTNANESYANSSVDEDDLPF